MEKEETCIFATHAAVLCILPLNALPNVDGMFHQNRRGERKEMDFVKKAKANNRRIDANLEAKVKIKETEKV